MSKRIIIEFNNSVLSVLTLLDEALANEQEVVEKVVLPSDWTSTQSILRGVAEDLMISASVDEAKRLLKRDLRAALTAVLVAKKLKPEVARLIIERAHAKAPADFSTLPCLPLAMFLFELCDSLEMPKQK